MSERNQLTFLAVGMEPFDEPAPQIDVRFAASARETISLMRFVDIDLILACTHIPDMDVWTLVRRIRAAWPGQRWALIGNPVTPQEEIRARSLGALMVVDGEFNCSLLYQLASSLLAREPATITRSLVESQGS